MSLELESQSIEGIEMVRNRILKELTETISNFHEMKEIVKGPSELLDKVNLALEAGYKLLDQLRTR